MDKHAAARAMRERDSETREEAIAAAGDKVHDLRPYCEERRKQRDLAQAYRRPPNG